MASLKEIKSRIQSVKSTQKITAAMKMVSSSKLRKAQKQIESFYPYEQKLTHILNNFLNAGEENTTVYSENREVKRVAIVVCSSNSSLCGSFNSNIAKKFTEVAKRYHNLGTENILVYPIGKKIFKAIEKMNFVPVDSFDRMSEKPTYAAAQNMADNLMKLFRDRHIDKVELIYHHFASKTSQKLVEETLLPIRLEPADKTLTGTQVNYLVEPDRQTIMNELIPKTLRMKLFTALLDSNASEHAARTIAMQIATDNADDLLQELNLQYNKSRQQAITNELLDIIGGSFGQT